MITKTYNILLILLLFAFLLSTKLSAQVGISVTPPRVYYTVSAGQTEVKEIMITNVSKDLTLDLSITLGDWKYNELGENVMYPADSLDNSLAAWVSILSASYLSLKPNESQVVSVSVTVPNDITDSQEVHTAMLYVTQMNPIDDVDEHGANIKINVRSGIKLFQRSSVVRQPMVEISNLTVDMDRHAMWLEFSNIGNVWIDSVVNGYLFNNSTGKETELNETMFYTMPGDVRKLCVALPDELEKGTYTATLMVDYGDANNVEAAEIEFEYE